MKLSEQITNQLRVQGLMKPFKIFVSTLSKWRDEVAQLEEENEALKWAIEQVRDRIGDRTHGAMLSECEEWHATLNDALLTAEGKE